MVDNTKKKAAMRRVKNSLFFFYKISNSYSSCSPNKNLIKYLKSFHEREFVNLNPAT